MLKIIVIILPLVMLVYELRFRCEEHTTQHIPCVVRVWFKFLEPLLLFTLLEGWVLYSYFAPTAEYMFSHGLWFLSICVPVIFTHWLESKYHTDTFLEIIKGDKHD